DLPSGSLVASLHSEAAVVAVAFSPDGHYVATASGDALHISDVSRGTEFARLTHQSAITAIAIAPKGNYVATSGEDATARIWEVHRYEGEGPTQEVTRVTHQRKVSSVAFSPDGKFLAEGSEDGSAGVWEVSGKQEAGRMTSENAVAMSPNGKF